MNIYKKWFAKAKLTGNFQYHNQRELFYCCFTIKLFFNHPLLPSHVNQQSAIPFSNISISLLCVCNSCLYKSCQPVKDAALYSKSVTLQDERAKPYLQVRPCSLQGWFIFFRIEFSAHRVRWWWKGSKQIHCELQTEVEEM